MDSYRVAIAPILDDLGASIGVHDALELDSLEVGTERFDALGPASFDVTITNSGTAVVALGTITFPVKATCARCLCDFDTVITGEVDGFYVRPGADEDVPEEQEVEYIDGEDAIDLLPALLSALVLEAPFAPLHDEECAGICPDCGADLNEGPCGCEADTQTEHPFAALKSLVLDEDVPAADADPTAE